MKKKDNKKIAILYFLSSLCFYIIGIINFTKGENISTAIIFLCLGSTYLCLGTVYLNKDKKDKDSK